MLYKEGSGKTRDGPLKLTGERVWRTYTGGGNIDRLYGKNNPEDTHFPEEWMFSVTRAFNAGREHLTEGICCLEEDPSCSLKMLLEKEPEGILGKEHTAQWGPDPGVLIKIIDSSERLTIQVHPDKKMAEHLFSSSFGKTECWHILEVDERKNPCIYLGLKKGITREKWKDCFERQDISQMLSLMNCIKVRPGETYLVQGGMPHAIGAGCMLMEIQEPTDLTIRVERITPSGFSIDDRMCHQGIGFERMFDCFSYVGYTKEQIKELYCIKPMKLKNGGWQMVGYEDTPCFRMESHTIVQEQILRTEKEFYCVYIEAGRGELEFENMKYPISRNAQFFIPANCGSYKIKVENDPIKLLKFYGPKVNAASGGELYDKTCSQDWN